MLFIKSLLACAGFILFATQLNAASAEAVSPAPQLHFQSAKQCAECHQEIYQEWSQSWMSKAFINPVFQQDYQIWRRYARQQGDDPTSCLRCHAPVALLTDDLKFKQAVSGEGVTCTVCHKVALVRERQGQHFLVMDPRNILYSTRANTAHPGYEIRASEALSDSSLCAGCHLDILADGTPLETTYNEWKHSSFAKQGTQCMDCHMPTVKSVVTGSNKKLASHRSHRFSGAHSNSPLLNNAAGIQLLATDIKNQLLVKVSNKRAGHNFPTGGAHPSKLVLSVTIVDKEKVLYDEKRYYEFTYLNKDGVVISGRDSTNSWQDSTLKPQEVRAELFDLPALPASSTIKVTLVYVAIPSAMFEALPAVEKPHYKPVLIDEKKVSYDSIFLP